MERFWRRFLKNLISCCGAPVARRAKARANICDIIGLKPAHDHCRKSSCSPHIFPHTPPPRVIIKTKNIITPDKWPPEFTYVTLKIFTPGFPHTRKEFSYEDLLLEVSK